MQSSKSQIKQDNHLSQSAGYAPVSTVAVNARCRQIPLLTVHTAGSCGFLSTRFSGPCQQSCSLGS